MAATLQGSFDGTDNRSDAGRADAFRRGTAGCGYVTLINVLTYVAVVYIFPADETGLTAGQAMSPELSVRLRAGPEQDRRIFKRIKGAA